MIAFYIGVEKSVSLNTGRRSARVKNAHPPMYSCFLVFGPQISRCFIVSKQLLTGSSVYSSNIIISCLWWPASTTFLQGGLTSLLSYCVAVIVTVNYY